MCWSVVRSMSYRICTEHAGVTSVYLCDDVWLIDCDTQVEQKSQSEGEKRDFLQRIADREEALHQANVSTAVLCSSYS